MVRIVTLPYLPYLTYETIRQQTDSSYSSYPQPLPEHNGKVSSRGNKRLMEALSTIAPLTFGYAQVISRIRTLLPVKVPMIVLYIWAINHCITELFGDTPTAYLSRRLDLILQGLVHRNIRRDQGHLATRLMALVILRPSFLRSLSRLVPFCLIVSMLCPEVQIPEIQRFTSVIETKYAFEDNKSIKIEP
uniref:Uncharacterized protein n=1 Tax=Solanum tuberosum TaxID=4113 RepID=M1DWC5_SOLTU